ncbi:MAG: RcnB family protein [Acidobacteriaceae bacterium]
MNPLIRKLAVSALALTLTGSIGFAQDHPQDHPDNHAQDQHSHYVHHSEWKKGSRISHDDWQRGEQVDWHTHHLRQPPRGYEWREVDGNYVLAAIATGVIASVIIASSSPH